MSAPTTITSIQKIKGAVVFDDYSAAADLPAFEQHNLIYGFNGSGKTTISRIFSSLGSGRISDRLPPRASFSVALSNHTTITSTDSLDGLKGRVVVYNEDFKSDNFRWAEGEANPVFYIGTEQKELSVELESKQKELENRLPVLTELKSAAEKAGKSFAKFKTDTARDISKVIEWERGYKAPSLVSDYAKNTYDTSMVLSEEQVKVLNAALRQTEALPTLSTLDTSALSLATHLVTVRATLAMTTGEATVEFLKGHESMTTWIKLGYEYHHEHKLNECLFCGRNISPERMTLLLNEVVDEKFKRLQETISTCHQSHQRLAANRLKLLRDFFPTEQNIFKQLVAKFPERLNAVRELLGQAEQYFVAIDKALTEKRTAPNTVIDESILPSEATAIQWENELATAAAKYNELIEEHNRIHNEFEKQQLETKDAVKQHHLAKHQPRYSELDKAARTAAEEQAETQNACNALSQRIVHLQQSIRQHGPAATKITKLIANFLGHNEITVAADDEVGYRLKRSGKEAKGTLSEGEKTAITLCYFLASLESDNKKLKDLIVVIDDPISSLDTKSLNYAFNLLRAYLDGAAQLIILTHNLHFMNEVKKWIKNRSKYRDAAPPLFFIDSRLKQRAETRHSRLVKMSKLIREYESEYHYLFSLILLTSTQEPQECEYIYLMPNAMRKVLEIFLSFKVPGGGGIINQIKSEVIQKSGINLDRLAALTRLSEVESHGDNLDDITTFSSMTVEETHEACCALLDLIAKVDENHHAQICKLCK